MPAQKTPLSAGLIQRGALLLVLSLAAAGTGAGLRPYTAHAQEVAVADLMRRGPLDDLTLGPAEAEVTVVVFVSLGCYLCAQFHNDILPGLKSKYVDTGRARFIFRDFPVDNASTAAALLVRCAGNGRELELVDRLFARQDYWAIMDGSLATIRLFQTVEPLGVTQQEFDECLSNHKLLGAITAARNLAVDELGIRRAPTFFMNGRRFEGDGAIAELGAELGKVLKEQ